MNHTYKANQAASPELREELASLERALNDHQPGYRFQVLHVSPAKVWGGLCIYADGSDVNLGSGPGAYLRNEANTDWLALGQFVGYSPGSITVPTETANLRGSTLNIGSSETVTIQGTGELILLG